MPIHDLPGNSKTELPGIIFCGLQLHLQVPRRPHISPKVIGTNRIRSLPARRRE
jgi:hypothetical protein